MSQQVKWPGCRRTKSFCIPGSQRLAGLIPAGTMSRVLAQECKETNILQVFPIFLVAVISVGDRNDKNLEMDKVVFKDKYSFNFEAFFQAFDAVLANRQVKVIWMLVRCFQFQIVPSFSSRTFFQMT